VGKLTDRQFWSRFESAGRLAELKGARFPDDTAAAQLRRKAEAVVLPWRFNGWYLPHYFRSAPAGFHLAMYRALETSRRTVTRAPRGHAKSTVITFGYGLHQVVCAKVLRAWGDGRLQAEDPALHQAILDVWADEVALRADPALNAAQPPLWWDPYIQIISVTEAQAEEFTEAILLELQENELLRSDWGEMVTGRQAAGDWVSATDVRVKAFGMMGNIRGGKHGPWRPTLALIDDPDSEETTGTARVRDRQTRKLTAAVNYGLEPKVSRIFVMGTPVHGDCLVCRLTSPDRYRRWTKLRFAAIDPDGKPLWPERWDLAALQAEEEEDPEAFGSEMMDRPPSSGKPFEVLHRYSRKDYEGVHLAKTMAFDPSLGRTETSDYQALVVLAGPTAEGHVLVWRCWLLRIPDPEQLVDTLLQHVADEQPDVQVIEAIAFQALLAAWLAGAARDRGMLGDWIQIDSQEQSKDLRIRGLAGPNNRGVIRWPDDNSCRQLEHQAQDYPDGKRDGLDAMEMAWRQIRQASQRSGLAGVRHVRRRSASFGAAEPGGMGW
jgi:hypothetical protein